MKEPLKTANFFVILQWKMLIYLGKLHFSIVRLPRTSVFLEVPMRLRTIIVLVAFTLISLPGCKTSRAAQGSADTPKGTGPEVLAAHEKARARFETISFKGKGEYTGATAKDNFTFTYKINIAHDSLIWASISKFGIEGMRLLADRDSIWLRRMDIQEGVRCDYTMIRKATGINADFYTLQSLLLGELKGETNGLRYVDGTKSPYRFEGTLPPYQVSWYLDGKHHKLVKAEANDPLLNQNSLFNWQDFRELNGQMLSYLLSFEMYAPQKVKLAMTHTSITLDGDNINFNFSFPDNYAIKNCMDK